MINVIRRITMLNFKGYDHININVKNLESSVEFYQKVFGFEVKEQGENGFGKPYKIIGLSNQGFLCLYQNPEKIEHSRVNHIGVHVDNLHESISQLKSLDIEIVPYGDEDGLVSYPQSHSLYIKDPDGNEIELSDRFGGGL